MPPPGANQSMNVDASVHPMNVSEPQTPAPIFPAASRASFAPTPAPGAPPTPALGAPTHSQVGAPTPSKVGVTFTVPHPCKPYEGHFQLVAGLELQHMYAYVRRNLVERVSSLLQKKTSVAKTVDELADKCSNRDLQHVQLVSDRKQVERKIDDLAAEINRRSAVRI